MNNDSFKAKLFACSASAISSIAIPWIQSLGPVWMAPLAYGFPFFIGLQIDRLAATIFEVIADNFALKHSSDEEVQGFHRLILAHIEVQKSLHSSYPSFFSADGNLKEDVVHPSLEVRLKAIEVELLNRRINPDTNIDEAKLKKLKAFHIELVTTQLKAKGIYKPTLTS